MSNRIAAGILLSLFLFLSFAGEAAAQTTVRGQVYLPNGDTPRNELRFYLESRDGRRNEYRYTDSNGRFILERLPTSTPHVVTFEGDGQTYETTVREFTPLYEPTLRIILRPLERKPQPAAPKVKSDAVEMHQSAMKELEKNNVEAAEKHLRRALEIDPGFVDALNDLGALLMRKKNYAEAERILRKALERDPHSLHALLNLGVTLNHLERYSEALVPLRDALEAKPGLIAAHLHLGVALVELERFAEAEPELLRAVKASGDEEVPAHLYLGKLYARTGQYAKAIASFEAYLAREPNSPNAPEARQAIERMRREMAARK